MRDGGMLLAEHKSLRRIQDAALELGLKLPAKTMKKDSVGLEEWIEEQQN
jgi:hypothetical protein